MYVSSKFTSLLIRVVLTAIVLGCSKAIQASTSSVETFKQPTLHHCIGIPFKPLVEPPRGFIGHTRRLGNPMYDASIKKWSSVYLPTLNPNLLKAQLIAESGLNPNAKSVVGAMGLGQFMPLTWKQMQGVLGIQGSAYNPETNIQASAYYMSYLRGQFKAERPEYDRHSLALASYNAGLGNILKAQKLAGGSYLYPPMAEQLHRVTGRHHKETLTYVNRIWEYHLILNQQEGLLCVD